jgi:hypothetical protein
MPTLMPVHLHLVLFSALAVVVVVVADWRVVSGYGARSGSYMQYYAQTASALRLAALNPARGLEAANNSAIQDRDLDGVPDRY